MAQYITPNRPAYAPGQPRREELSRPVIRRTTRKADDATGINVLDRAPISPKMPNLPPA